MIINDKYIIEKLKQWEKDYNQSLYIKIHKSNRDYQLLISKYINGKWYAISSKYLFSGKNKVYKKTILGIKYLTHFNINEFLETLHKWYYETVNKYNDIDTLAEHSIINNFKKSIWK